MSLQSFPIVGLTKGYQTNVKPAMLPDQAWALLENSYVYRERVLKREGRPLLGRLRRVITDVDLTATFAGGNAGQAWVTETYISNITQAVNAVVTCITPHNLSNGSVIMFNSVLGMVQINGIQTAVTVINTTQFSCNTINSIPFAAYTSGGFFTSQINIQTFEPNAQIEPGSYTLTLDTAPPLTLVDQGDGTLIASPPEAGNYGTINYTNCTIVTHTTRGASTKTTVSLNYFPGLPSMGINTIEGTSLVEENTIFFDTVYAYQFSGSGFQEYIPGTIWDGGDADFFWSCNYRGGSDGSRLFFVTNGLNDQYSPMRYTDTTTWTNFTPIIEDNPPSAAQSKLFQARILIPYYGRLLALNTWEGTTAGGNAGATNFYNRCRFSQLGSPIASDAWRSDQFGKGGFLDAPTDESIVGCTFIKNTLVVDFENTTWQLRYVGEYGLPFIWERISADFGSESTFSGVLFDNNRLVVGDKALTAAHANAVDRIDLDIPDQIFSIENGNDGRLRVYGIRDYQKELVYWNYPDSNTESAAGVMIKFPNKVLVYNYRNRTWAIFRDSITTLGTFQATTGITWSDTSVFWSSTDTLWSSGSSQEGFPLIVCGDQQGFISVYGNEWEGSSSTVQASDQETLMVNAVNLGTGVFTSSNHNLQPQEIIYISGMLFVDNSTLLPVVTTLNDVIYQVQVVSKDTFSLLIWNSSQQSYIPVTYPANTITYIGGGVITLFPRMNILTKDINVFQGQSMQTKLSYLDFLFEPVPEGAVSVNLYLNASTSGTTPGVIKGNKVVGNTKLSLNLLAPYYTPGSQYSWFKFFATLSAQYFNINVTYDDDQMNTLATHSQTATLYGINAWCRAGGRSTFGG